MKKKYMLLLFAFFGLAANAQNVGFQSPNFKWALVNVVCADTNDDGILDSDVDTNNDGEIQVSEALAVTNLDVSNHGISNSTGINAFANLKSLNISGCGIATLSISGMHNLKTLNCSSDGLYSLHFAGVEQLETLNCSNNGILALANFSDLVSLKDLNFSNCRFDTCEVSNLMALEILNCSGNIFTSITAAPGNVVVDLNCSNNTYMGALDPSIFPNLKTLTCNSMALNTLDVSSLVHLEKLICNNNNLTSLGIANPSELKELTCYFNQLTSLNASQLTHLETLNCYYNNLITLDLSNANLLKTVNCGNNNLNSLILTSPVLETVDCSTNGLTVLNCSTLTALKDLDCSKNMLTSLSVQNSSQLKNLDCNTNQLPAIGLSALPNLEILDCSANQISALDANNLTLLKTINCSTNHISSLDVTHSPGLETLKCTANELTALDITPLVNLKILSCSNNQISDMDFSHSTKLRTIEVGYNLFTSLDFTQVGGGLWDHYRYYMSGNHNLTTVNMKNGGHIFHTSMHDPSGAFVYDCPNLTYVCADEFNLGYFSETNANVSSYCSFAPGGTYNTITGSFTLDYDNNGCDTNDDVISYSKITIDDGNMAGATFTKSNGNYSFYTQTGDFTIAPAFEHPYFIVSPESAVVSFAALDGSVTTQNFCVTPNGTHNDVEISVFYNPARPGFDATYYILFQNNGNQILSGQINFTFDDAVMDLVAANPAINGQSLNTLTWNYENLMPFENRSIFVAMNLNSPQETPPLNNGDILNFSATINPVSGDETPADNTFAFSQTVTNSYDPNDKTCLEGETLDPEKVGDYLHYAIRFQNSGTAVAENVVVQDVIDTEKYDVGSLQLVASSHPQTTRINGNKVEFIFEGINLPTEQDNEPASHGLVVFKIKTKSDLAIGSSVSNKADIFFDYNFPIATNTATSTFGLLNRSVFEDTSVSVYPNPTKNQVTITAKDNIKALQLYDVMGRLIKADLENSNSVHLDLSANASGIYFVKIITEKGSKTEKIIKK